MHCAASCDKGCRAEAAFHRTAVSQVRAELAKWDHLRSGACRRAVVCARLRQATSRGNSVHMQVRIGMGEGGGATFRGILRHVGAAYWFMMDYSDLILWAGAIIRVIVVLMWPLD